MWHGAESKQLSKCRSPNPPLQLALPKSFASRLFGRGTPQSPLRMQFAKDQQQPPDQLKCKNHRQSAPPKNEWVAASFVPLRKATWQVVLLICQEFLGWWVKFVAPEEEMRRQQAKIRESPRRSSWQRKSATKICWKSKSNCAYAKSLKYEVFSWLSSLFH